MNGLIPLSDLRTGQTAQIISIDGPPDHVHRLEEFGLHRGTLIEMYRPGTPCIVRLGGIKVCFRANHGLRVLVCPIRSS